MTHVTIRKTVAVEVSPEVTFAALTDWAAQREWMVGTTVSVKHQNGVGVGGSFEARTGLLIDPMQITIWEPPYRCGVLHTGRVVRGSGLFEVQPVGAAQSLCIWSEELEIPFGKLGRAGWRIVQPFASLGIVWSLHRFKRWCEHRHLTSHRSAQG